MNIVVLIECAGGPLEPTSSTRAKPGLAVDLQRPLVASVGPLLSLPRTLSKHRVGLLSQVLLGAHSHTHLFSSYLWLPQSYNGRAE